ESRGDVTIRRTFKDGNVFYSFTMRGAPVVPTVLVTEKWMVGSIMPGAAQSFVLRESGKLPKWEPNEQVQEALKELPKSYSCLTVVDPAPGYRQLLQFAPLGLNLLETQILPNMGPNPPQLPFSMADLPAAELVTAPMFPNVSVAGMVDGNFVSTSRQSVPDTPLGNLNVGASAPVLVALLLPAVQQAREAARRTQSRNNLKQLGLAMHNYHDVYRTFPRGTVENDDLEVDERLSFVYSLLPFVEQAAMYDQIDAESGWQSDANAPYRDMTIPVFQNPSQRRGGASPSSMDYVGIAGIGPDAAELENHDPKAGIFGYDRSTGIRDITDGTSNTLMIGDSSRPNLSWMAGGRETIRGFSQSPYLNGPDEIGSPHAGIVQFLFADGSVRAISVNIDEQVLEGLATKAGGEVIGGF
ncbi:MAG: DUF1559 domain-containing protein, partial [Planctomycetaceae bacterium]|nr:DUF1559 domain-containing protein [Planctomycetaceae bacterium]